MLYDFRKSRYFMSLPEIIKESIMQSGVDFINDDEMRLFVANQNMQ